MSTKFKKLKAVLALLLVVSVLFSMSTNALAVADNNMPTTYKTVFIDDSKAENIFLTTVISAGNVRVEQYVNGNLIATVTASTKDGYIVDCTYKDSMSRSIDYLTLDFTPSTLAQDKMLDQSEFVGYDSLISPRSYSLAGTINYKPYYDDFGDVYKEKLNIYLQAGTEKREDRTLRVEEGYAAAIAVAAIAAILVLVCPPMAALAETVLGALAIAAGTTIVGGFIQGAITKTYYTKILPYDIKATDPETSRNKYYTAEKCYCAVPGTGSGNIWSSDYYYNGYLPWNSNSNASMMFSDFWGFPYPGMA